MDAVFLANLQSPPLLFFFLGATAVLVRSDLEIPTQVAKFLSLYLLFAIGFKGGAALADSELDAAALATLSAALLLATLVPVYVFFWLRRLTSTADAAAIAATYGSVSAVTFIACAGYLDMAGIAWSGYMVAAMVLMESPAIIVGILLFRLYSTQGNNGKNAVSWQELCRDSVFNGSVFLIIGSLVIGWLTGERGMQQVGTLVSDLFIGVLCLFLLDMGIVAARRIKDMRQMAVAVGRLSNPAIAAVALVLPLVNAVIAGGLAVMLGMSEGNALLFTVLGASASYIAVPAAMRLALPEANPSVYLPMALAVTFPFNLLVGIPLYHAVIQQVMGG